MAAILSHQEQYLQIFYRRFFCIYIQRKNKKALITIVIMYIGQPLEYCMKILRLVMNFFSIVAIRRESRQLKCVVLFIENLLRLLY